MPNFTFKLNEERWRGWQTELTGIDHSNSECNMTVIINAEDRKEAERFLGLVVDHTNFDSVEDTNDLMVYEIPGGCGSK